MIECTVGTCAVQLRALELTQAGKTYHEIADELGYANRSSAWRLVRNGLDRAVGDHAEEYLQLSLDRLEALIRTLLARRNRWTPCQRRAPPAQGPPGRSAAARPG